MQINLHFSHFRSLYQNESYDTIKISSEMLMEVNEYLLSHKDDGKDDTGIYLISRH